MNFLENSTHETSCVTSCLVFFSLFCDIRDSVGRVGPSTEQRRSDIVRILLLLAWRTMQYTMQYDVV